MVAATLTAIATIYLFASLLVLAPYKPGYSHIKHTISEIGEIDAPHQRFVAFGLFLPIGLLLLDVTYLIYPISPVAAGLALCISAGYVGAALFPCDPGSPVFGSTRQTIHNIAGAIEYLGGGIILMTIARDIEQPFKWAGLIVLGAAIGLLVLPANAGRGLLQRVAEVCLFGSLGAWQLNAAI